MTWHHTSGGYRGQKWSWRDDDGATVISIVTWIPNRVASATVEGPEIRTTYSYGNSTYMAGVVALRDAWSVTESAHRADVIDAHLRAARAAWPYAYAAHRLRTLADRTYARFTATLQAEIDTRDGTGGMRAALRQQEHADRLFARWGRVERLANACAALAGGEP